MMVTLMSCHIVNNNNKHRYNNKHKMKAVKNVVTWYTTIFYLLYCNENVIIYLFMHYNNENVIIYLFIYFCIKVMRMGGLLYFHKNKKS